MPVGLAPVALDGTPLVFVSFDGYENAANPFNFEDALLVRPLLELDEAGDTDVGASLLCQDSDLYWL